MGNNVLEVYLKAVAESLVAEIERTLQACLDRHPTFTHASRHLHELEADLKAWQDVGEHMVCPRCGVDCMTPKLHHNAFSRHADIYICDECGLNEAMLDYMNNPLPIQCWAHFRAATVK